MDRQKPEAWKHIVASIQSLAAFGLSKVDPQAFDIVVIDEFHHAEAPSYRRFIEHLKPIELLGLTATPERGDGINVADSCFGGRIASELRLWDALDADLLVPFHYFGVADDDDLTVIEWKRGSYDLEQLSSVYTGNDVRALKIINELRNKVLSTSLMRALGFCVSVQHAHYMAKVFNEAGIPSVAVSGKSSTEERESAFQAARPRTELSIRRFGDHPLLPLGATDIAVGDQHLPAWEPPASSGFHLVLDGADPLASRVPSRSGPAGVVRRPGP